MRLPVIRGIIDRRILVNYKVDPALLCTLLPPPFRPQLVRGWGIAGICLIRLKHIRPRFVPALLGLSSENAAHRVAVEWDQDGEFRHGVYVPRRDTSSRLNTLAGGRVFPGKHCHARFDVAENVPFYRVALDSDDGQAHVLVEAQLTTQWPTTSVFESPSDASRFFERGSVGHSPTGNSGRLDGLELRISNWRVQPIAVERIESSFFDDASVFPRGSATFDSALLMTAAEHEWHQRPALCLR